jgi:hypothetical protein
MAGGMSLEEAAAKTALDINESFSSLPNWQSVFRNPTTRDFLRTFLFSMAEQESWLRMPFRQKALLASILVDVTVVTVAGMEPVGLVLVSWTVTDPGLVTKLDPVIM